MRCVTFALAAMTGVVLSLGGCSGPRPLHVVRDNADWAMREGKYEVAVTDYSEYLDRMPDGKPGDVEVRFDLGMAYLAAGDCKKAMEHLSTCVDVRPENEEYASGLAAALFSCNESDRLTLFLRRRTAERGTPADYILLGVYANKMGHPDEALQALLTAARIDEGRTLAPQMALASFYGSVNDKSNEIRRLRMALYISPGNQMVEAQLKSLGEVVGPTLVLVPEEAH